MPFRLTVGHGENAHRFALAPGENLVGSDPGCEVRISDPTVSRHHASLIVSTRSTTARRTDSKGDSSGAGRADEAERLQLADLNSLNGTWVDRQRIKSQSSLDSGSAVRFGSVDGIIDYVSESDTSPFAPPQEHDSSGVAVAAKEVAEVVSSDDEDSAPSPALGTTAAVGPLSLFTLGQLPHLLDAVVNGEVPHVLAARAGEALLASLPIATVDIFKSIGDARVSWFANHDLESDENLNSPGWQQGVSGDIGVAARFDDAESSKLYKPLLQSTAALLNLAYHGELRATESDIPSRLVQKTEDHKTTVRPPDPPTVEPIVRVLYDRATQVARGDINVLIQGESGTGKELLARFIHLSSPRSEGPFVALNCAALPRDLQETELFGIEKGVATGVEARPGKFELADEGTLFLDEIGDMAPEVQAKILRVLQEGEVFRIGGSQARPARARILSATHQDLHSMMKDGRFRSDLYHRIADWRARVPALRERRNDIPNLARFFLHQASEKAQEQQVSISKAAVEALLAYDWPGNIRQLEREIVRARLFVPKGGLLDSACLSEEILEADQSVLADSLKEQMDANERRILQGTLRDHGGDVNATAAVLEVPVSTLYRKLKSHGLS